MVFSEEDVHYMKLALQQAEAAYEQQEVPVGAIIVYNNRIIGKGHNRMEALKDPTAHAEIIAVTAATQTLDSAKLNDCTLYVTLEPCVMCIGAILLARISKVYFGGFDPKFGACGSLYNIAEENKYNHSVTVFSGLLEKECTGLLKMFFQKIRSLENLTESSTILSR